MLHNLVFSSLNGFKLIDFIIRLQIYCFFVTTQYPYKSPWASLFSTVKSSSSNRLDTSFTDAMNIPLKGL